MKASPIATVYTQVYNAKPFLPQCIMSVLHQTYKDFEYILIDNGSTDGCKELLEQYAAQDSRIRLIRFEQNRAAPIWWEIAQKTASSPYIANLDSDDWWEPDYLESLIGFLERNKLDLAITGTVNYFEESRMSRVLRKLDIPLIMSRQQFAQNYPQLWTFPSTNWANVIRTDIFRKTDFSGVFAAKLTNGGDTASMLKYMEHCQRIGIDNTALYHYRIRPKQVSRTYYPQRFSSNVYVQEAIRHFLELNRAFDAQKENWLKIVYFNAINTTLSLLRESSLPGKEKMEECTRIVAHPLTVDGMKYPCVQRDQWIQLAWDIVLEVGSSETEPSVSMVLFVLCPRCRAAVTELSLFQCEPILLAALRQDDPGRLAEGLLNLIAAKKYTKQYDLAGMLQRLAEDKPLLRTIDQLPFLRKYRKIYWSIWQGNELEALEEMTGMLLEKRLHGAEDVFLQLYITLAAMLEQVPAFLFGKVGMAQLCLRQGRRGDCRAILDELAEMGVESEEIAALRGALETKGEVL